MWHRIKMNWRAVQNPMAAKTNTAPFVSQKEPGPRGVSWSKPPSKVGEDDWPLFLPQKMAPQNWTKNTSTKHPQNTPSSLEVKLIRQVPSLPGGSLAPSQSPQRGGIGLPGWGVWVTWEQLGYKNHQSFVYMRCWCLFFFSAELYVFFP